MDEVHLIWQANPYGADGVPTIALDAYQQGTPASFHIVATGEAHPSPTSSSF